MSNAAVSNFMTDLVTHFPKKHESPAAEKVWLQSMASTLRGYSDSVLRQAAQNIIDTREDRYFPLPAECKQACDAVQKVQEIVTRAQTLPQLQTGVGDEWSPERVKFAYELVRCGMGRQAAQDNTCWVLGLWHFCRKFQRLPETREIDQLKRDAREFDEAYAKCVRGVAGPMSKVLEKLGASMLKGEDWKSREKLCAEVLSR